MDNKYELMHKNDRVAILYKEQDMTFDVYRVTNRVFMPCEQRDFKSWFYGRVDGVRTSAYTPLERFGMMRKNYFTCVHDCFWLKDISDPTTWEDVNPRLKRSYDEVGMKIVSGSRTTSITNNYPINISGRIPKAWAELGDKEIILKGTPDSEESLNEVFYANAISILGKGMEVAYCSYWFSSGRSACYSFVGEEEDFLPFKKGTDYNGIIQYGKNYKDTIDTMIVLDFIVGKGTRPVTKLGRVANWGGTKLDVSKPSPIFGNDDLGIYDREATFCKTLTEQLDLVNLSNYKKNLSNLKSSLPEIVEDIYGVDEEKLAKLIEQIDFIENAIAVEESRPPKVSVNISDIAEGEIANMWGPAYVGKDEGLFDFTMDGKYRRSIHLGSIVNYDCPINCKKDESSAYYNYDRKSLICIDCHTEEKLKEKEETCYRCDKTFKTHIWFDPSTCPHCGKSRVD